MKVKFELCQMDASVQQLQNLKLLRKEVGVGDREGRGLRREAE